MYTERRWIWKFASLAIVLGFLCLRGATPAMADQIYVCTGCTKPPAGDPNVINPLSINVGFAGSDKSVAPLLIIVGVPKDGPAPTISLPIGVLPDAASSYYHLNAATTGTTAGALEGTLTAATKEAYAASGLVADANSELFVNWNTYDTSQGISDGGSFNLYAYAINFALNSSTKKGSTPNSPINIDFTGTTAGSFVIGYTCDVTEPSGVACPHKMSENEVSDTPFTNSGVILTGTTKTPEPATLTLFGSGLIALAGAIRRRRVA